MSIMKRSSSTSSHANLSGQLGSEELKSWDQSAIDSFLKSSLLAAPSMYSDASNRSRKSSIRSLKAGLPPAHRETSPQPHHSQSTPQFRKSSARSVSGVSMSSIHRSRSDTSTNEWLNQDSVPSTLQPYVHEAIGLAEEQLQRSPNLRKISVVKSPSPQTSSHGRGLFWRKKKGGDDETAIVFAFDESVNNGVNDERREGLDPDSNENRPDDSIRRNNTSESLMEEISQSSGIDVHEQAKTPNALELGTDFRAMENSTPRSQRPSQSQIFSQRTITSEEEAELKLVKKQRFWDYLTMVASMIYAVGFTIFGFVFYLVDLFVEKKTNYMASDIFNIYLCLVGIMWLGYLQWDISSFVQMMEKYSKKSSGANFQLVQGEDGELLISIPISSKELPEYYCFSSGRHSGSFFLKIGASAFCLGHLVFIGLSLGKQIVYFMAADDDDGDKMDKCIHVETLIFSILQPIYVFLQLYIIFKFSNVIVNRSKWIARFAFMHCIMSSLCFWLSAIIAETMDSILAKEYFTEKSTCHYDDRSYVEPQKIVICRRSEEEIACNLENSTYQLNTDLTCILVYRCECTNYNEIAKYIFNLGPYLYPFSIEFSILVVGIWYVMWSNIGKVEENRNHMEFLPESFSSDELNRRATTNTAMVIYADCHSSMKGVFMGLIFVAATIIGVIFFFILGSSDDCDTQEIGTVVNDSFESAMLFIMILVTCWVYYKISGLEVNPHPISFLDDLLLLICVPSFFLYFSVSILPALDFQDSSLYENLIANCLMILQVVLQTPMIVDGLRRCSDSDRNQDKKPGRNSLTFLLVANLAIYFWETMEIKNISYQEARKEFYGARLWTLLSHVTMPLCIFYRFHSAVALADIWGSAYKPGDHH